MMQRKTKNKLRKELRKKGLLLKKDHRKNITANNLGGYMIVDESTNSVIAGGKFELTLEDVESYLQK